MSSMSSKEKSGSSSGERRCLDLSMVSDSSSSIWMVSSGISKSLVTKSEQSFSSPSLTPFSSSIVCVMSWESSWMGFSTLLMELYSFSTMLSMKSWPSVFGGKKGLSPREVLLALMASWICEGRTVGISFILFYFRLFCFTF